VEVVVVVQLEELNRLLRMVVVPVQTLTQRELRVRPILVAVAVLVDMAIVIMD